MNINISLIQANKDREKLGNKIANFLKDFEEIIIYEISKERILVRAFLKTYESVRIKLNLKRYKLNINYNFAGKNFNYSSHI